MEGSEKLRRLFVPSLMVLALVYAALASLRTVINFDLGWQVAAGRYVVQHWQIPSTDVFSYTARGKEWIYPPLSGVLLYAVSKLGGFAALSWLGMMGCCATIALLLRRGSAATAALAVIAVPAIASATTPGAELFTTVLFAAFVAVLWRQFRGERAPLWCLPLLMLVWVNSHPGFIAGLAMMGAYGVLELLELLFASRRRTAWMRLRQAAPWLLATVVATLLNHWGPRIYVAIARQERIMNELGGFFNWWLKPYVSIAALQESLDWHNPDGGYWWLLGVVIVVILLSLARRQLGVAAVLAVAAYVSLTAVRYQGLFACLAVTLGGTMLSDLPLPAWGSQLRERIDRTLGHGSLGAAGVARLGLAAAALLLVTVRGGSLIWNRYYLATGQLSLFGAGASWWYPDRACDFLLREHLPGNIFNTYSVGGYLSWKLGPEYPVYVDGRAVPFGADFLSHYSELLQHHPDSQTWLREADLRNINTILVPVSRYAGLEEFPLAQYCGSQDWRPVYLDDVSAIFVRNRPENAPWLKRLQIDCRTVAFSPPPTLASSSRTRQTGELYNFFANAGTILYVLGHAEDALKDLKAAEAIFPDDNNLHLTEGQLFQAYNRPDLAERQYLTALRLRPTDMGWYLLSRLRMTEGRYDDAADALAHSADLSYQASNRYLELGELDLQMHRPQEALKAFARAASKSPYAVNSPEGAEFSARVARGQALAWQNLGDLNRAIEFQKRAVAFTPEDPEGWSQLAGLYKAQGRADLAQQADQRAAELRAK